MVITVHTINAQNCGGTTTISGTSSHLYLDPDNDGDIVGDNTVSGFSDCSINGVNEIDEFEVLTNPSSCAECQKEWTAIPRLNETIGDLWAGGASCGNTEIVADNATSSGAYAYYTIINPDGVCDNGDELLVFRIRTATTANGSFSYSLLIDTDGLLGAQDPDGV